MSILGLTDRLGKKILKIKIIEKLIIRTEIDSFLRPLTVEIYGFERGILELEAFKIRCIGIMISLLFFGCTIALLSGLGIVEILYVFVFSVVCGTAPFYDLRKKVTERRYQIKKALPDFISRLVLLVEAGMTLSRGFEIASKSIDRGSPLYAEVYKTCNEISNGVPETQAYEQLAVRCKTIEIARFSSMLIQNLRKGNSELAPLLRMVASECWNARKAVAKKKGEEAAAKMLIPVSFLLIAVLIVTAGPALASLLNVNTIQIGR